MKHLFLTSVFALFLISTACSQSTPNPPKTPSKGTSYSIDFDFDDDGSNSSVTIKKNESLYKLSASFDKHRTSEIKDILLKQFGRKNLKVNGSSYTWIKNNRGEEAFECKLTKGKLRMYVDKEYATEKFTAMISNFGDEVKDVISGTDSKKEERNEAERALKDAERELKRAKQKLEMLKKQSKI